MNYQPFLFYEKKMYFIYIFKKSLILLVIIYLSQSLSQAFLNASQTKVKPQIPN